MPSDQTITSILKDTELKLKEEQNKFETIFYESESAMVIFQGPDMIFEMFNSRYQEIYPNRELLGKSLVMAIPELKDSKFPDILKKVYETGNHFVSHEGLALIYNQISGKIEERYFDTTFSRINYGEGKPYRILATPKEVTDRVIERRKLEESLRELELERDLRERFVSALSHDLRTPLAIAKMGAQVLKMKTEDSAEIEEMADRISLSVDRADRMIRDLLDANRIKAGVGIPINMQECRLDIIIDYVVNDLKEIYGQRFHVKNELTEIKGYWDDMAVHRLIENLVINAVKYGAQDSAVTIRLTADDEYVEIAVHNQGKVISEEEQKYLFNQYNRAKSAIASGQVGWGIGLSLVKGIAEAHSGFVRVESTKEAGTTFYIKLPLDARKKS